MDSRGTTNKKTLGQSDSHEVQQKLTSGHNPYLSRFLSKKTPIGQLHQVQVPEWNQQSSGAPALLQQRDLHYKHLEPLARFQVSRVDNNQLEEYLSFVQSYFEEKNSDYFSQGTLIIES